jgi:hypothetical protein
LQIEDPTYFWRQLEVRFCHKKMIFLPKARHDWANLRVYDFSNFSSYNNELFKIVSQLHLCEEDKSMKRETQVCERRAENEERRAESIDWRAENLDFIGKFSEKQCLFPWN